MIPIHSVMVSSEPAELFNELIERGWSDGLPVLPPTRAAVEKWSRLADWISIFRSARCRH